MPTHARKVLLVSTSDTCAGTERYAWLIYRGLREHGTDAWLAVGHKSGNDPRVVPFYASPHIDYRRYAGRLFRWKQGWRKWAQARLGVEDFEFPFSRHLRSMTGSPPNLIHCHNLHGDYFDLRVLRSVSRQLPVVLTLQDDWMFTGHCCASFECGRWEHGCGRCPSLATPPAIRRDATHYNWRRKRSVYRGSQLFVATPSAYLMERVRRSILAPAIAGARVIPNAVDLSVFRPRDRGEVRQELGIDPRVRLIVLAVRDAKTNPFKDYATMCAAIRQLGASLPDEQIEFLVVGERASVERQGNTLIRHVPSLVPGELAKRHQAADVYFHIAREEVFGVVVAEAMACGAPVVTNPVGGLPELVVDGEHGLHIPTGSAEHCADALRRLFGDDALRHRLGRQAAIKAQSLLGPETMVNQYRSWYEEVLDSMTHVTRTNSGKAA